MHNLFIYVFKKEKWKNIKPNQSETPTIWIMARDLAYFENSFKISTILSIIHYYSYYFLYT